MIRCLSIGFLVLIGAAPQPEWPRETFVRWPAGAATRTIHAGGLTARIENRRCGIDRPRTEACYDGGYVVTTIDAPGRQPVAIEGAPGVATYIGIGRLASTSGRPALIIISDSGGSGGCVTIDIAVPQGADYRPLRLRDRGRDTHCRVQASALRWPRDLTGHGRAEFELADDAFACAFTSCAASWSPLRVVAIDEKGGQDVSTDPALTRRYRADMIQARTACVHRRSEPLGACAAYAANAARIGRLPEALATLRARPLPIEFLPKLHHLLADRGYLRTTKP